MYDILLYIHWRAICISPPICLHIFFLPSTLVAMEILIYMNQHMSLSLVKQDVSMVYRKLVPSPTTHTWLFQHSLGNMYPSSFLNYLHVNQEVANCLPSSLPLSLSAHCCYTYILKSCFSHVAPQKPQWPHWLPRSFMIYLHSFAHKQLPCSLGKHKFQPHSQAFGRFYPPAPGIPSPPWSLL